MFTVKKENEISFVVQESINNLYLILDFELISV